MILRVLGNPSFTLSSQAIPCLRASFASSAPGEQHGRDSLQIPDSGGNPSSRLLSLKPQKNVTLQGYMGRISERQGTAILLEFLCYDQLNSLKSFLPLPYLMCSGGEG